MPSTSAAAADRRRSDRGPSASSARIRLTGPGTPWSPVSVLLVVSGVLGALGTVLTLAGASVGLRLPLLLFFFLTGPAAAVALSLRGLDPLARIALSGAGGLLTVAVVAEAMVASRRWSVAGGAAAVGALILSWLALRWVLGSRSGAGPGSGERSAR